MASADWQINNAQADREKRLAALSSVLAAVGLTSIKLVIGLLTGSLGILAEAAHSGLDLVAAAVTFFAVRLSGKPPDPQHTYGYGKVENLSALFETLLLLVTCVWIIYEAVQRLFFTNVQVETSIWAFLIMAVSIVVDFSRSRMLSRVAKKYESQALEADALHFSTDIWSSSVVIFGLALVFIGERVKIDWLGKADSVAAMGVAGIVIYISMQLGRKTITDLLDAVPPLMTSQVTHAVQQVPGVVGVKQVRLRRSGPAIFADVSVLVSRDTAFEAAHEVAQNVEQAVHQVLTGDEDVVVNVTPAATEVESVLTKVRLLAARHGLGAHGIRAYDVMGNRSIELHLEVNDTLRVEAAHEQASQFEEALRAELPGVSRIVTHIEPTGEHTALPKAKPADESKLLNVLENLPVELGVEFEPHDVQVNRVAGILDVSFHCLVPGDAAITDAHRLTERIEAALRGYLPHLGRVVIHVEPVEKENTQDNRKP